MAGSSDDDDYDDQWWLKTAVWEVGHDKHSSHKKSDSADTSNSEEIDWCKFIDKHKRSLREMCESL